MSSTTINDPTGSSPANAYDNDKNMTKDVLLFVENSNLAEAKGLFKVNTVFDTSLVSNNTNTQPLSGGGTDTTKVHENIGRFQAPFACSLVEMSVSVSNATSYDASNYFTITVEKAPYVVHPVIPVTNFSLMTGMTITVDGNTATELFQIQQNSGLSVPVNHTVRFKVERTGALNGILQLQAIFKMDHV